MEEPIDPIEQFSSLIYEALVVAKGEEAQALH
jgi:hypothetical protein